MSFEVTKALFNKHVKRFMIQKPRFLHFTRFNGWNFFTGKYKIERGNVVSHFHCSRLYCSHVR